MPLFNPVEAFKKLLALQAQGADDLTLTRELDEYTVPQKNQIGQVMQEYKKLQAGSNKSIPDDPATFAEQQSYKWKGYGGIKEYWSRALHLDLINDKLVNMEAGKKHKLIIAMPPRHGKTEFATFWFPLWYLARNPTKRVVIVGHTHEFIEIYGRRLRDFVRDCGAELGLKLDPTTTAAHRWNLLTGGSVVAVGRGGPLTGRGADCFVAGTQVMTSSGNMDIAVLAGLENKPKVLSYDHKTNKLVWRSVVAARKIQAKALVSVHTSSGNSVICTPEHRIYSESGYREAQLLKGCGNDQSRILCRMQRTQEQAQQKKRSFLPRLLSKQNKDYGNSFSLQLLQKRICKIKGRVRQVNKKRPPSHLLQQRLQYSTSCSEESQNLFRMRSAYRNSGQEILSSLLGKETIIQKEIKNDNLRRVSDTFLAPEQQNSVLWNGLQEQGSFQGNDRSWKFSVQGHGPLQQSVQKDSSLYSGSGKELLRSLQQEGIANGSSSHRRRYKEQCSGESNSSVFSLSYDSSQVQPDPVLVVQPLRAGVYTVYDIQVEGTNNFFANGILVHNCLIIDDPIKDAEEANSQIIRDKLWDWWQTTASTRLEPGGICVSIATRWHWEDLNGRLEEQNKIDGVEKWEILSLPALAEANDPLGRKEGEPLWADRYSKEILQQTKLTQNPYHWGSVYQQRPTPMEGGLFKFAWWQYYEKLPDELDLVIQSWDLSFKDTKTSDYVVGQVWGRKGARFYLIDQIRERLSALDTIKAIKSFTAKYPRARAKLIEDKANGPAVIAMLQHEVSGIIPVKVKASKSSRAMAIQGLVEAGNVFLPVPALASWTNDFVLEHARFKGSPGDTDDMVDSASQALAYLSPGAWALDRSHDRAIALDGEPVDYVKQQREMYGQALKKIHRDKYWEQKGGNRDPGWNW